MFSGMVGGLTGGILGDNMQTGFEMPNEMTPFLNMNNDPNNSMMGFEPGIGQMPLGY